MTLFKSLQWAAVVQNVVAKASFTNACWGDRAGLQLLLRNVIYSSSKEGRTLETATQHQ